MYNLENISKLSEAPKGEVSSFKQYVAEQEVLPEVFTCQTHVVEELIKQSQDSSDGFFSESDLEVLHTPYCEFDGEEYSESDLLEKLEGAESLLETLEERFDELEMEYSDNLDALGEVEDDLAEVTDRDDSLRLSGVRRGLKSAIVTQKSQMDTLEKERGDQESLIVELQEALDDAKYPEVYEWWLVSDRLARRLKENGHIILEDMFNNWYGRQACGQALALDYSFQTIGLEWAGIENDL